MAEHGELIKQAGQVEEEWLEVQESLEQIQR